jgi:hypothetical protein
MNLLVMQVDWQLDCLVEDLDVLLKQILSLGHQHDVSRELRALPLGLRKCFLEQLQSLCLGIKLF